MGKAKKPSGLVSAYTFSKNVDGPTRLQDSFDSGSKEDQSVMISSDAPERNNYYQFANPQDAQDAYDSLQAENEMRVGMKKGGKAKKVSAPKKKSHPNW